MHKTYIARVLGSFPDDPIAVDRQLAWDSGSNHAFLMEADGSLSHKQSMGRVPEAGQNQKLQAKEAQTSFMLLSVAPDARTSLVECQPKTGRTHQIRSAFGFAYFLGHVTHVQQICLHLKTARNLASHQLCICRWCVAGMCNVYERTVHAS